MSEIFQIAETYHISNLAHRKFPLLQQIGSTLYTEITNQIARSLSHQSLQFSIKMHPTDPNILTKAVYIIILIGDMSFDLGDHIDE